jgi:hypothetical protein
MMDCSRIVQSTAPDTRFKGGVRLYSQHQAGGRVEPHHRCPSPAAVSGGSAMARNARMVRGRLGDAWGTPEDARMATSQTRGQ